MDLLRKASSIVRRVVHSMDVVGDIVAPQPHSSRDRLEYFQTHYHAFVGTAKELGSLKVDAETGARLLAESGVKEHIKNIIHVLIEEDSANLNTDFSVYQELGGSPQSYPCLEYFF